MASQARKQISIKGVDQLALLGLQDNNLRCLQKHFDAKITARGSDIIIDGLKKDVRNLEKVIYEMILQVNRGKPLAEKDLIELITSTGNGGLGNEENSGSQESDNVILYTKNGMIKPKSAGQLDFCKSCEKNDIIFAIGPAGTGKTFLAVSIAVAALRDKIVTRIMLTRPAVEAGERLGFLPGDFREKIDPYLRPLYDALHEMIPPDKLKRYLESGVIEIVPLAYMRGRTLNDAFVILDEAQNTTVNQMKMFLTRLGINSRAIITGDITQIDLPESMDSGLVKIQNILSDIEGIKFVYLNERDVVRHRLVRDIIKAYGEHEKDKHSKGTGEK